MAEARNPFSFQNFVRNKPGKKATSRNYEELDGIPDHHHADGEFDSQDKKKKDQRKSVKKEENPFSFKKFLNKDSVSAPCHSDEGCSDLVPGFADDWPDLVQDDFRGVHTLAQNSNIGICSQTKYDRPISLPDLAFDSDRDSTFPDKDGIGNLIHKDGSAGSSLQNVAILNDCTDADPVTNSPQHIGLPDYVADSVVLSADSSNGAFHVVRKDVSSILGTDDPSEEIKRLKEENDNLKQQLLQSRDLAERESKRVLLEIEVLKKREKEETAALETMVQIVEANLQTTTKRAVKAENTVKKLKQEIKNLQGQIASLSSENAALSSGDPYLADMKDRTNYVAQQLSTAAQNADQSLRQLLNGVANLRLMSDILRNVGKLTEHEPAQSESF